MPRFRISSPARPMFSLGPTLHNQTTLSRYFTFASLWLWNSATVERFPQVIGQCSVEILCNPYFAAIHP